MCIEGNRSPWDVDAYERRVRCACFVCELVAGNPAYWHHVVDRDASSVVFLAKYPWLRGHLIAAPVQHRERAVLDFGEDEYASLQRTIHRAGRALQEVVATELLYVLSLGSQQGNRHTHWHLVPLPPGVPYQEQQLAALAEERGWLDLPTDERPPWQPKSVRRCSVPNGRFWRVWRNMHLCDEQFGRELRSSSPAIRLDPQHWLRQ